MKAYRQSKVKGMKIRWRGKTEFLMFKHGQICDVISIERGWFRVIDNSGEDYLYPPKCFEIVERQPISLDFTVVGKHILLLTSKSDLYRGFVDSCYICGDKDHKPTVTAITLKKVVHEGKELDKPVRLNVSDIANIEEVVWKIRKSKTAV